MPSVSELQSPLEYTRRTVENVQLAYDLARRNLQERVDKQAPTKEKLSFPSFKAIDQVFIHRPYSEANGHNPKLNSPWRGLYTVRAQLSPVIYRTNTDGEPSDVSVHLGGIRNTMSRRHCPPPTSKRSTICS